MYYSLDKSNSWGIFIALYSDEKKNVKKRLTDKNGCILIHDIEIDDSEYILISLYNCNTELEKLNIYYLYLTI